ncbi:MAG TPA: YdeI/OmpD-associated family protein [Frankiaceae bacterium]|jgi:hypothetical protein|nr:YdeI/OmpD-associated family protein [Frankiaceae bacterium]
MRFRAVLELHGKTATGVEVPAEVVDALGSNRRPAVIVTIGPHTWRSTIAPRGGVYLLGVSAENRALAGVCAGDELDVDLELDAAPREVEVPADLAVALKAIPGLRQAFDALAFTHRKEHVRAIEDAKTAETRARRITKAVDKLSAGLS